jgi:drug/metabolite transporter (DMT)-like permease
VPVSRARLALSLSAGIVAISSAATIVRMAQAQGVPSLSIAAWRLVIASAVLLPYAWLTHRDELRGVSRREWGLLAAAGVTLGLHFATWIASLGLTSVASSVVLVSMGPLFVALGSWLFLHERPSRATFLGILLAAVGSVAISWGDLGRGQDKLAGDLLALAGGVLMAAYLMIGRKVRARRSLAVYIAVVYGAAMVTMLAIVAVARQPMLGFRLPAYGWLLALGLFPQLVGHSTLNWALRHLSATFVAIITLAEPIGSGILAFLLLGEDVILSTLVGGILILTGIYIASRAEVQGSREPGAGSWGSGEQGSKGSREEGSREQRGREQRGREQGSIG